MHTAVQLEEALQYAQLGSSAGVCDNNNSKTDRTDVVAPGIDLTQAVHMRDLRKLDTTFGETNEPCITVRKQAILINAGTTAQRCLQPLAGSRLVLMTSRITLASVALNRLLDPLRTIIMRNACIVFIPDGADSLISILKDKFRELFADKESEATPFEFRYVHYTFELLLSKRPTN